MAPDGDSNSLVKPRVYDLEIALYIKFLDVGVVAYNQKNGIKQNCHHNLPETGSNFQLPVFFYLID